MTWTPTTTQPSGPRGWAAGLAFAGLAALAPCRGQEPPPPGALLGVQHQLACADSRDGLVHVRSVYQYAPGTDVVVLRDQAGQLWDFESPAIQDGVRSLREAPRFLGPEGQERAVRVLEDGGWRVELPGAPVLIVEQSCHIPDRTSDRSFQQPSAASLGRTSLVFLGRELFLWPEPRAPSHPAVMLLLMDSPNWSLATVAGQGRVVALPSLAALRDHFVFAGKDLLQRTVLQDGGPLSVVLSAREHEDAVELLDQVERLAVAAGDALGPRPPGPRLLVLLPFQDTSGLRRRAKRGASTAASHLAYVDREARPYYPEHPLATVAHELTHAWLPYGRIPTGPALPAWFAEGASAWYEAVHPWRAGLWDADRYLDWLAGQWVADQQSEVGQEWTLREASDRFLERSEAPGVVYRRGALLAAWIDVLLRECRPGTGGLDGFLRELMTAARVGGGWKALPDVLRDALGEARFATVEAALDHPGTFDLRPLLERYGAAVVPRPGPALGFLLESRRAPVVRAVEPGGPAEGRLEVGDIIRRVDGQRVATTEEFQRLAEGWAPAVTVRLLLQRGDERREQDFQPGAALRFDVRRAADPDREDPGAALLERLGRGPARR